jgi:hypothetical protein
MESMFRAASWIRPGPRRATFAWSRAWAKLGKTGRTLVTRPLLYRRKQSFERGAGLGTGVSTGIVPVSDRVFSYKQDIAWISVLSVSSCSVISSYKALPGNCLRRDGQRSGGVASCFVWHAPAGAPPRPPSANPEAQWIAKLDAIKE